MDATLRLSVDTSPFSQVDRRFFAVLLASMMVHALAATWVARQPHVSEVDAYESAPVDRFLKAPLLPIPKNVPLVKLAQAPSQKPPSPGRPHSARGNGGQPAMLQGLVAGAIADFTGQS